MRLRPTLTAGALLAALAPALAAQEALPGYAPAAAARQRALEAEAAAAVRADRAAEHARALARLTHVAGTPGQAETRDYVVEQMRAMGLQVEVRAHRVWLPHATSVRVWRVQPDARELDTREPPLDGDPTSTLAQYPAANGYSAPGDVSGEVVYANYGLIEDYATLDSLGVSVRGRIVVARYGRSFRGIKAREAERRGAIGLILYSDPADDGAGRGPVWPEGPWRPATAIQRGSVYNGMGDPSTPDGPSGMGGGGRLPFERMTLPRIPVVALSAANAAELLRGLQAAEAPAGWQGGLGFPYRVGPGPVQARVAVETDAQTNGWKEIWNTVGILRGAEEPDQVVVIGAHRDAWGPGAVDNVSGTVAVLEAARVLAEQARAGNRPRRTILFATWDAEEWGLIGSTEFVQQDSARLRRGGVAYLNQDVAANGSNFGAGGSPSLRSTLRDVADGIPAPEGEGSVYALWRRQTQVADTALPAFGNPGGGSDFAPFYNRLGIPHADWGFGGPYGVYHSQYDGLAWMERFGDPGYRRTATSAAVGAAMLLRLANAEVLPYDYVEYARTMRGYLPAIDAQLRAKGWDVTTAPLAGAIARMERAAVAHARARDGALAAGRPRARDVREANEALLRVERALTRRTGLRGRPWMRSLTYAADENNGYATMIFPGIGEAIRANDRRLTDEEIGDLAERFLAAADALIEATGALSGVR